MIVRAIVLDSNRILSDLKDLDESIRFIENSNRPICTLFRPMPELEAVLLSPNPIIDIDLR
jgi:hypothetical protein